ncbi:MAG: hypothetical protein C9356_11970 [Oleiphilus sp.]|nr:MAG: hypothetical protein C9356_11970 [Oleiphilus sp.]
MFSNEDRSNTACHAIEFFAAETGINDEDKDDQVKDLLTNLRHYCDHKELDFNALVDSSYQTYLVELQEDQGDCIDVSEDDQQR